MMGWSVIILTEVVTISLWLIAKIEFPTAQTTQAWVQVMGLIGIVTLAWTDILAVRHRIVEQMWGGLDKVYRAHQILGALAFVALVNHAVLLIVGALPVNTLKLYLLPGGSFDYTLGQLALYLMFGLIFVTLYVRLPYRFWKWSHEWMGLTIIFGGLHGLLVASDTTRYTPLRYWVLAWVVVATIAFIYKRFIYYWTGTAKYRVVMMGKQGELLVISMEGVDRAIKFCPGQYGFFSLPNSKRDEHPFSVLGSQEKKLIIGVKIVGNFTKKLASLSRGAEILVKGPYGNFGEKMQEAKHAVWIAGGIGITPFLSMAKAVRSDQKVELFFCARVLPPNVITKPFENLSKRNPLFAWLPCETNRNGRLTGKRIFEDTGCDRLAYYLLCGPQQMMESLAEQLALLGVRRSHIIYEDFAFK